MSETKRPKLDPDQIKREDESLGELPRDAQGNPVLYRRSSSSDLALPSSSGISSPSPSSSTGLKVEPPSTSPRKSESEEERRKMKEKKKLEQEKEEREKMQVLVSHFTEEQLDRYEMYRRAAFPKAAVKRIMQTVTGSSVSQSVVISMSGIAKVYIGEVIEEALDYMEESGETGPLKPKHLREAARRVRLRENLKNTKKTNVFMP